MGQRFKLQAVDEIQIAEKDHYLALQQYARALRMPTPRGESERLRLALCAAFARLRDAHDALALHCDD